ncbi:phage major capsid protein [Salibacterium salarium]|uniref:Phage major capsid protein n=2 Tax=Salibacterium salarium TaxID=284579 RepID=A0A3R9P8L0_9BACI|nr:phage major capsid protein [Salibacterium salarium]
MPTVKKRFRYQVGLQFFAKGEEESGQTETKAEKRKREIGERKTEIRSQLEKEEKVDLDKLHQEVRDLDEEAQEIEKRERLMKETEEIDKGNGGETRTVETFNTDPESRKSQEEQEEADWEQRGANLHERRAVTVASGDLITPDHQSSSIKSTFNQVSTLIDRVSTVPLQGGESYESPFEIQHGEGNYTAEGEAYFDVDHEFGYATINKSKVTAYNEITEEVLKLPRANYAQRTVEGVRKSLRKKMAKEILVGTGSSNEFTGIFSSNATAINPSTDKLISEINENTLDEIIYGYGGDEDVEDESVLILSKDDLRKFAMLRIGNDNRKAYEVVPNGNTGTINGVAYIINSGAGSIATAADGDFLMAYGPLSNYEMAVFSPTDIKRSEDFKFKEGMIAHRGSVMAGGNVVAHNGFLRVKYEDPAV